MLEPRAIGSPFLRADAAWQEHNHLHTNRRIK